MAAAPRPDVVIDAVGVYVQCLLLLLVVAVEDDAVSVEVDDEFPDG